MADKGMLLVYGDAIGRVDSENIVKHLDRNGYGSCEVVVRNQPHESVRRELMADARVEVRVAADPARQADERAAALTGEKVAVKVSRLEDVSDRSFNRCPC